MSKSWNAHSEEERKAILAEVANVYAKHHSPAWLKAPSVTTQIVNDLSAGTTEEVCSIEISATAPVDQKVAAAEISTALTDVFKGVAQSKVTISAQYGVGDLMPAIENANKVSEEGKATITHQKGQVILYDFWATWCPPC